MKEKSNRKQRGFGIVDLMISMSVGSVLIAGVTGIYVDTIKYSASNVANIRLEQDLQAIIQLVSQEMRRAGYDGDSAAGGDTDFGIEEVTATCIRYSYDRGAVPDGAKTDDEKFGFRIVNSTVQFGTNSTSCLTGTWTSINNVKNSLVTTFTLNLTELCTNLNDGTNCNSNDSPTALVNPYVVPSAGNQLIKKFQLNLNLAGHPASDDSYSKTVDANIRLLNEIRKTQI